MGKQPWSSCNNYMTQTTTTTNEHKTASRIHESTAFSIVSSSLGKNSIFKHLSSTSWEHLNSPGCLTALSSAEPSTPQCPQPIFPTNPRPLTSSVFPTNPRPTPASTALTTGTPSSPPVRPQPLSPQARRPIPRTSPQASPLITQPHHLLLSFSHSLPLKENPHEEQQLLFLLPLHQGISTLCSCCLPSVAATHHTIDLSFCGSAPLLCFSISFSPSALCSKHRAATQY
jgi:hypothetical protein